MRREADRTDLVDVVLLMPCPYSKHTCYTQVVQLPAPLGFTRAKKDARTSAENVRALHPALSYKGVWGAETAHFCTSAWRANATFV